MILNYLIAYAGYCLGATIFILDVIKKYQLIADSNPNPNIVYNKSVFWRKEKINVIQMFLYGIISVIILPQLFGGTSFQATNSAGSVIWTVPMKAAMLPLQIIVGYSGGRMIIAFMGKSKQELYKKVGITEDDEKK